MNIDRDIEPSPPAPDRDAGRDRDPARQGHRREHDAKHPRRDFSDRVDGVVRDVAAVRVVALVDLITHQFDGHPFAGRRGIGEAEQRGWIERQTALGPKGGHFTVVVATPAGAARRADPDRCGTQGPGRGPGRARAPGARPGGGGGVRAAGARRSGQWGTPSRFARSPTYAPRVGGVPSDTAYVRLVT